MKAKATITGITKYTTMLLVCLTLLGLLFRATLYWLIPVEPGQPAGFGDVIELLIYLPIISMASLVLLLSVVAAFLKNYGGAIRVFLVGVASPLAYYFLHSYVPRLI